MKKILTILLFMFLTGVQINPVFSAVETPTAAVELYNAGIDFYNSGDTEKSIESFKKAITIDPQFFEAHYNLVQIQNATGKIDEAIATYTILLEIRPDNEECAFEFGQLLHKRGYLKRALIYLDRVSIDSANYQQSQILVDKIIARQEELKAVPKEVAKEIVAVKKENIVANNVQEVTAKSTVYSGIPSPSGVAADKAGNVYIASYSENIVYKIDQSNKKTVFVTQGILDGPIGLAVDDNNNLYVANYIKGNVLKITPEGEPAIFLNVKKPYCLNVKAQMLYITEQDSNTTIKFPL